MRRVHIVTAICMAAFLCLGGCGCERDTRDPGGPTDATDTVSAASGEHTEDDASGHIAVETRYGDLYYAAAWGGPMETTQSWDGDTLTVSFKTTIRDVQYGLFDIIIGRADEQQAGTLTDSSGVTRVVYARMLGDEALGDLTKDEQDRIYAMREELNTVLGHLN